MKGMIFTEFMEMVEEANGLEAVDQLIERTQPASGGAYTSVGNYDYGELLAMVSELSRLSGTPVPDLVRSFGQRVFKRLFVQHYGSFFKEARDCFTFLEGIETYIHTEVRKLYPDAELPLFKVKREGDDRLIMEYRSTRPFADLAHGLILGCVGHYQENIAVAYEDLAEGKCTAARFTLTKGNDGG